MKGNYVRKDNRRGLRHGEVYRCNHPLYSTCTLFRDSDFGLAIIQQRFNPKMKISWWDAIDPWLANDIFEDKGFNDYFIHHAGAEEDGLYPTIEVRKVMYALGMKPMKRKFWETSFRSQILQPH